MSDLTSSKQYADSGDAVTLTCAYTNPTSITPTVTWYYCVDNVPSNYKPTTTGISSKKGQSLITFASSAVTNSGNYKCKVDWGTNFGSQTGISLKQIIRGIDTGVIGTKYIMIGSSITHTCTVYGDALTKDVVWSNTAGALTGSTYTQDTTSYTPSTFSTTSTLTISAVTASDTTAFTCTVEYTEGPVTKKGVIDLEILSELTAEVNECLFSFTNKIVCCRMYSLILCDFKHKYV